MGIPQTPSSPPHLYPQALQLKLYQAFIFSIPILFSIILFLLFYLFYLKRRASALSSPPPQPLPEAPNASTVCQIGLKKEVKDMLPTVLFDEELRNKESQCCVCLGEFEIKEELLQIPTCNHVFHIDCIHHWLHSNSTCPLCRSYVIPSTKLYSPSPLPLQQENSANSNLHHPQISQQDQQEEVSSSSSPSPSPSPREHIVIPVEG